MSWIHTHIALHILVSELPGHRKYILYYHFLGVYHIKRCPWNSVPFQDIHAVKVKQFFLLYIETNILPGVKAFYTF